MAARGNIVAKKTIKWKVSTSTVLLLEEKKKMEKKKDKEKRKKIYIFFFLKKGSSCSSLSNINYKHILYGEDFRFRVLSGWQCMTWL